MNKAIEYAWKAAAAAGSAYLGIKAGKKASDWREEKRREELLEKEQLRHKKVGQEQPHKND